MIDEIDKSILRILQTDCTLSIDDISERVHLSRNACWRRIKTMESAGLIAKRVALLDPAKAGCPLTAIVLLRTSQHDAKWIANFTQVLESMPEVISASRMTGDLDYVLRVRLKDVPAYDKFYKDLTSRISVLDISASFVMEDIKETTAVPL